MVRERLELLGRSLHVPAPGLGRGDGVRPNQNYLATFQVTLATSAARECVGIGGQPGESVFIKRGAAPVRPEPAAVDLHESGAADFDVIGGRALHYAVGPGHARRADGSQIGVTRVEWIGPPHFSWATTSS